MKKLLSILAAIGWMGVTAHAQSLGIYTFAGAAGNETTFPVDVQPADATFSDMSRGTGVSPSTASGAFSANGWTTGALDADDYYEFTLSPAGGFSLTLTNLAFAERRSSTGPSEIAVRSSLDGYVADVFTTTVPDDTNTRNQTVPLGAGFADQAGPVTFRLYGFGSESEAGTWRIDDVELFGSINSEGPPPTNVQFVAASASVGEDAGTVEITVYKTVADGNVSGSVLVGGTATEGVGNDFTINTTTFDLNGATTSATFIITINDDAVEEPAETVVLTLSGVTGAGIGTPGEFTLTITDNDGTGTSLIISEVADPADDFNGRFVELFNAGGVAVDLALGQWHLTRQANGGSLADIALTGTIPAGGTYIIANSADFSTLYPLAPPADQTSGDITGNGDDGYFLYSGGDSSVGNLEDAYGVLNVDGTGEPWEYLDGRAFRNSDVTQANPAWTASEWTIVTPANLADMTPGVHPDGPPVILTNVQFTASSANAGEGSTSYTVTVTKTASGGSVSAQIALSGTATVGADYTISSTNLTLDGATTTADVIISINDDDVEETPETVILTLVNVVGAGLGSPSEFTLTLIDNDTPPPAGGVVWINEINYDPAGTDVDEFVEVAGAAGTDLSVYSLHLYNGNGGAEYDSLVLSGTIPDDGCGFGAVAFDFTAIQNGSPDGVALVSNGTVVVEFLSYEGSFTATDGPANGLTSVDIGVAQVGVDDTVQLTGPGSASADFTWALGLKSKGSLNDGQAIVPCGGDPVTNVQFTASAGSVGEGDGTFEITVYKTVDTGNVSGDVVIGGTAIEEDDFTINTNRFDLNGAVTSATFVVTLIDDGDVEGDETLTLTLANVVGGGLGSPSVFTLTIVDNDELPAPPAPEGTLATYEFNDNSLDPTAVQSNLTASVFSVNEGRVITFPAGEPSPSASANGWDAADRWFEFTLTVASGFELSVTNITFDERSSATGPTQWFLRSSLDGYTADLAGGPVQTNSTFELQDQVVDIEAATGVVTFRLYGAGAGNPSGTWRVDNVTLYGVVVPDGGGPIEPGPFNLTGIDPEGTGIAFSFETENSFLYTLEYTVDPAANPVVWTVVDDLVGDGNPAGLSDITPVDPSRIYRIIAE